MFNNRYEKLFVSFGQYSVSIFRVLWMTTVLVLFYLVRYAYFDNRNRTSSLRVTSMCLDGVRSQNGLLDVHGKVNLVNSTSQNRNRMRRMEWRC